MKDILDSTMRKHNLLLLLFLSSLLLVSSLSPVTAHNHHERRHSGPHHSDRGFHGNSEHMNISGTIAVEDAIILSIHVEPLPEYDDEFGHHHMTRNDFSNTIQVELSKLVEFEDEGDLGYDENDTIVSTYTLNSSTLLQPVVNEDNTIFTVSSSDNVVEFTIELREDQGLPNSWKWSLELNYPFVSNSTSVGIVQTVTSNSAYMHRHHAMHMEQHGHLSGNEIRGDHPEIPMFFKWDEYAIVDGLNLSIAATFVDADIVFSIPQGETIFYDPEIGVDADTINDVEGFFENLGNRFLDVINSPTLFGAILAVLSITVIFLILRKRQ